MYGPQTIDTVGWGDVLSADGKPEVKIDGITIDWTTVAALGAPVTLTDGRVLPIGEKYIPRGATVIRLTSVVVGGSTIGLYGPYDPAATDGRQTLAANADCYLLNHATVMSDPKGANPQAIYGGVVWAARVLNAGGGTHTLAAGPTLAEIKSTFPRLVLFSGN